MGEQERSVSRRTMLKRFGAAGAIAWVTPVISSLTTPAHAAGTLPGGNCSFDPAADSCSGQTRCDGADCFCNRNVTDGVPNGKTFCTAATFCENAVCQSDSDCGPGEVCQATCCDVPRCFVVCDPTRRTRTVRIGVRYASAP